jgi:hypothetical protein
MLKTAPGLLQFDYTFPENEELEKEMDACKLKVHLNLAAAKCQLEDWKEVRLCSPIRRVEGGWVYCFCYFGISHYVKLNKPSSRAITNLTNQ